MYMNNRICAIRLADARLEPVEAQVTITVRPERVTPATQVRGRLTGPRCPYTTTVEVAYPLRDQGRQAGAAEGQTITLRVVIPEPSFWDPQTPFLYEGPVELWQDGQLVETVQVKHGLRTTRLGPRALHVNGKPVKVCGARRGACSDEKAEFLHGNGYNTLLASAAEGEGLWDTADRWGFVVIHRLTAKAELPLATALKEHPCCLGWLVPQGPNHEELLAAALALADPARGHYAGMELTEAPKRPLPRGISFVACEPENLAAVEQVPLPKVALVPARADSAAEPTFPESAAVLGWISE